MAPQGTASAARTTRATTSIGVLLVGALVLAAGPASALVVCENAKGKEKIRAACKSNETLVGTLATEAVVDEKIGAAPGRALAHAHILADGTVDAANSRNVTQDNVTRNLLAGYCFHDLGFSFQNAVVSPDYSDPVNGGDSALEATVALGDPFGDCPSVKGTQLEVATSVSGLFTPLGFFIVFH